MYRLREPSSFNLTLNHSRERRVAITQTGPLVRVSYKFLVGTAGEHSDPQVHMVCHRPKRPRVSLVRQQPDVEHPKRPTSPSAKRSTATAESALTVGVLDPRVHVVFSTRPHHAVAGMQSV